MIFYCSLMIYVVLRLELFIAIKLDEEWRNVWPIAAGRGKRMRRSLSLAALSALNGVCVSIISPSGDNLSLFLLSVIGGSFLMAAVTDYVTCNVYRFVWWVAWAAGLALLFFRATEGQDKLYVEELIIFCLLQELFFNKLYGRADCHGFCAGALTSCAIGGGMSDFLLCLTVAFGLLSVIQGIKGNINRRGNLKKPVAFLPYIAVSTWVVLLM